ncbi:MAG: AMP-binding protein [Rhodovibrionaceae bacterium]
MNLASLVHRMAETSPDSPAVSDGERQVHSFASLSAAVSGLAGSLRGALGLQPGDRVALAMSNSPAFFETAFAAWHAGLCVVPINPRLHRKDFAYIFGNSGARLAFYSADLAGTLAGLEAEVAGLEQLIEAGGADYGALLRAPPAPLAEVAPEDPCWIFYTSGTTGRPKGATLTLRNLGFMIQGYYADIDRVELGDTMLHAASLSHGSGLYALPHIAQGGHQVVCRGSFDTAEICRLIAAYPQVSFFAAPTMLTRLVRHVAESGADTANLRTVVYGGGPMYVADLERALEVLGPKLAQLYGQGEAPMTITILPKAWHGRARQRGLLGTCGFARTLVDVRVVDEQGQEVPRGGIGEIVTRSDCVMAGYWNMPEATAATLRDGWLHSGDLGSLDADGFLTLKDRSKDLIISGGSNIYPREVEEVLLQHPGVAEAAVVSRPHADLIEEVVAFVVPRAGGNLAAEELDGFCLENLARYKRPRDYRVVEELPKNNYGKVLKTALRELLAGGAERKP